MTSGLLGILDDITIILDDVAAMSKLAAKKTAGLVGDDLAVNANVVVGLEPSRELPIVGKIALGSLANKVVLIPLALALPSRVIGPVLLFGGAFLCYEALHKILHKNDAKDEEHRQKLLKAAKQGPEALKEVEKKKVWGAIGTDTILSAEVIAVALGAVASAPLLTKAITLTLIGLGMTLGVYGLVAGIVKVDDIGLRLKKSANSAVSSLGDGMVRAMPYFMRLLSFVGTVAMFLVGGGILLHGVPVLEHNVEHFLESLTSHELLRTTLGLLANLLVGLLLGLLVYPIFQALSKLVETLKGRWGTDQKTHPTT